MDPDALSDDDLDQLAHRLAPHLPTGTHGDRVVLTRRQFAAAASGVLSAGALAAVGVDEASAQAAGQQGTASSPNNMFAYDLNVANQMTSSLPMNGNDIENAGSVSAASLNGAEFAAAKSGADADARLDAAIADATQDSAVYIETGAIYNTDRTITSSDVAEIKTLAHRGADLRATWTVDGAGLRVSGLNLGSGGQLVMSGVATSLYDIYNSSSSETILIQNDFVRVADGYNLTVTFESGTTDGLADTLVNSSVTDKGVNTIGDVV